MSTLDLLKFEIDIKNHVLWYGMDIILDKHKVRLAFDNTRNVTQVKLHVFLNNDVNANTTKYL